MNDCDHQGGKVYARRVFSNGSTHICVQCLLCLSLVKLPLHDNRPFLRLEEVPAGKKIRDWIDPGYQENSAQGLI